MRAAFLLFVVLFLSGVFLSPILHTPPAYADDSGGE